MELRLPDLVILDRDGVINIDSPDYIKSPDEWHPIAGSLEAIVALNQKKIPVGVASNQRGIARGLYSWEALKAIEAKMCTMLNDLGGHLDYIEYCDALERSHPRHKPNPGMLTHIIACAQLNPKAHTIYFIGDKQSDIEAAINANCTPILVRTGYGKVTEQSLSQPCLVFDSLNDCIHTLLDR